MEEFDRLVFDIFNRYYKVLLYKGLIQDYNTNNLIFIIFISKLFHICYNYITELDYKKIDDIIACMYGTSCIIPYIRNIISLPMIYTKTLLVYSLSNINRNGGLGKARLASL